MMRAVLILSLLAGACGQPRPNARPLNDDAMVNNGETVTGETGNNETTNNRPDQRDDWQRGAHDLFVNHDGLERTFRLWVPENYGTQPMPLLLVFHGGAGDGDTMVAVGFDDVADREGFLVVYPDGMHSNWADGRGTTDAETAGIDDIGFVRTLVEQLTERLHVDQDRVFATGASNGGMFSYRIGCELSDVFAGIAPVIAALPSELECEPERAISVISFHGTEDPFIPIDGGDTAHKDFPRLGDGGLVDSAEATMLFWQEHDGCDDPLTADVPPIDESDPTRVQLTTASCREGTSVHTYVIEGMGHTWPGLGGRVEAVSGPRTTQIDATDLIWSFFSARGQ